MKSDPYRYVNDDVKDVVSGLLQFSDDYHRGHAARLARTISVLYEMDIKGTLLEIGTTGLVPIAMAELRPDLEVDVTHFDTSKDAVDEIVLEFAGKRRSVKAYCVDLEHDVFQTAPEVYDAVLCSEVVEHMEIDPMFMLSELNRVTKYDGQLLLTTPNVLSANSLIKMYMGNEPYFFMQYHKSREYHRHNYEYSINGLRNLLFAAGYQGVLWTEDLFEDTPKNSIIEKLKSAGVNVSNIGDNILARCRKISDVVERWPVGLYV